MADGSSAQPFQGPALQQVRFVPLQGALSDHRLYVLLSPHLADQRGGNSAWVDERDSQFGDARQPTGSSVRFTSYWLQARRWEGTDFAVLVAPNG